MKLDLKKVDNVEVEGIDTRDYPDFCDAFISYADYNGIEMTDDQLEALNEDRDFVYSAVENHLY